MKKIDRTGERRNNINGLEMEILEYKNNKDIKVLFVDSGIVRHADYRRFTEGRVFPTWRNKGWENIMRLDEDKYIYDDYDESEDSIINNKAMGITMAVGLILLVLAAVAAIVYTFSVIF